jgi:hypothetical protein
MLDDDCGEISGMNVSWNRSPEKEPAHCRCPPYSTWFGPGNRPLTAWATVLPKQRFVWMIHTQRASRTMFRSSFKTSVA